MTDIFRLERSILNFYISHTPIIAQVVAMMVHAVIAADAVSTDDEIPNAPPLCKTELKFSSANLRGTVMPALVSG